MKSAAILVLAAIVLAGCGMNRAVGVLPNTLDDLAAKTAPLRGDWNRDDAAPGPDTGEPLD